MIIHTVGKSALSMTVVHCLLTIHDLATDMKSLKILQ